MLPAVVAVAKRNVWRQLLTPHLLAPHLLAPHLLSWLSCLSLMSASVLEKSEAVHVCLAGCLVPPRQSEQRCVVCWFACAPSQRASLTSSEGGQLLSSPCPLLLPLSQQPLTSLVPSFRVLGLMCACGAVPCCRLSRHLSLSLSLSLSQGCTLLSLVKTLAHTFG